MSTESRLPVGPSRLLLTSHILFAVGLVGAVGVLVALGVAGLRGAYPAVVYPAAHLVDVWVVAPLAVLALVTGLIQLYVTRWSLRQAWLQVKLLTTTAAAIAVVLVLEPRLSRSAQAALEGEMFTAAQFLPLVVAPGVALTVLVGNVILGLTKPPAFRSRRVAS